jgi:hypothetical protein
MQINKAVTIVNKDAAGLPNAAQFQVRDALSEAESLFRMEGEGIESELTDDKIGSPVSIVMRNLLGERDRGETGDIINSPSARKLSVHK